MRIDQAKGGTFSIMRVSVVIWSEGIPLEDDEAWKNHDVSKMKGSFFDTTGISSVYSKFVSASYEAGIVPI